MSTMDIINKMDDFWRFFEDTRQLSLEDRLQIFKTRIIEPNLMYYSSIPGINEVGLIRYIQDVESKIDFLASHQEQVLDRFTDNLKMFQEKFPKFHPDFNVYLLPSMNLFKGMAIPHQGQVFLLLGSDGLAELSDHHFNGYITHELFHAYHFQCSPGVRDGAELALRTMKMPPLWGLLWTEGIACQAVRMVHPEIPEEEVLDWRPLVDQTKPLLPELVEEAINKLTSDSPQDIAGFFYFPRENHPDIPTGCGYYIGMLVAERLARKWPIDTLLALDDSILVEEIRAALIGLKG
jgi:hypothetical protein